MRSPRYLAPPEEEGIYRVTYTQAYERGDVFDAGFLYEYIKALIKKATDGYYDALLEAEIYGFPEHLKDAKWNDTVILASTRQPEETP